MLFKAGSSDCVVDLARDGILEIVVHVFRPGFPCLNEKEKDVVSNSFTSCVKIYACFGGLKIRDKIIQNIVFSFIVMMTAIWIWVIID